MPVQLTLRTEELDDFGRKHMRYVAAIADADGNPLFEIDNHSPGWAKGVLPCDEAAMTLFRLYSQLKDRFAKEAKTNPTFSDYGETHIP